MNILCIGDSITAGSGELYSESYPHLMESYLKNHIKNVKVYNAGIPGFSSRDYFELVKRAMVGPQSDMELLLSNNQYYDAVIIMLGTNDCRRDNWVETADSEKYLRAIADRACQMTKGDRKRVYLCSILPLAYPMPPDIRGGGHDWRQYRVEEEINPMIRRISRQMGISFIDVYIRFVSGLLNGERLYDGIHPFVEGYRLIARVVGEALLESKPISTWFIDIGTGWEVD